MFTKNKNFNGKVIAFPQLSPQKLWDDDVCKWVLVIGYKTKTKTMTMPSFGPKDW